MNYYVSQHKLQAAVYRPFASNLMPQDSIDGGTLRWALHEYDDYGDEVPLFTVMMMMISYTFHWTRVSSPKE
jgi:hypothetical protein